MSFEPIGLELIGFRFNQVHRADNASELADGDLNATIWEGTDFWIRRRRASRRVHSDGRR